MCDNHDHHDPGPSALRWGASALVLAPLAGAAFLVPAAWSGMPPAAERLVAFAAGPLVALAAVALGRFLAAGRDGVALRLAVVAGVVGGALLGAAAVLHRLHWARFDARWAEAESDFEMNALREAAWGLDEIVGGSLDLAGALWLGLAAVLLAVALVRHPLFGATYGVAAAALGTAALVLELSAFPYGAVAPFESLLAVGALAAVVWVRVAVAVRRLWRGYAGWPEPAFA